MADVNHIKVHRWSLRGLSSVDKVELHGLGHASQRAYGSAAYLCAESEDGYRVSYLVMAKSRMAPSKRVTLPRLELLAAYITAKLLDYVKLTQGGREVKRVLRKCLTCKHWKTQPVQRQVAPLPAARVQIAPPFTNIGLDFTGTLYVKVKESSKLTTSKAYICIFICDDTRAVHLQLLNSMTTEDFLQAFRRMANRRRMAKVIHSDNQTTFHKAAKVFKVNEDRPRRCGRQTGKSRCKLKVYYRASHRGGHPERACRQLKEPLRKVLEREMMTVLTDIEAMINLRPLTHIGDDIRNGQIITPALLAMGRDLESPPDNPPKKAHVSLSELYRYQQRLKNH